MGFSAITARLGLDAAPFNTSLASAVSAAQKGGQQIEGGLQFKGAGAIKRQISGLTQAIISGGSAADVFAGSALHLANTLRVGVGGAIGLGVGAVLVKSLIDSYDAATRLRHEFDALSQIPLGGSNIRSLESINAQFDALSEHVADVQKSQHLPGISGALENMKSSGIDSIDSLLTKFTILRDELGGIKAIFTNPKAVVNVFDNDLTPKGGSKGYEVREAHRAESVLIDQLAEKESKRAEIEEARLDISDREAERKKLQLELEQKLQALSEKHNKDISGPSPQPIADAYKRTEAAKERLLDYKHDKAEQDEAENLEDVRMQGEVSLASVGQKHLALVLEEERVQQRILALQKERAEEINPAKQAQLQAKEVALANELTAKKQAEAQAANDALSDARGQTREMELQSTGAKSLAEQAAIDNKYQKEIRQALRDGNDELAKVLQKQQAIAQRDQQIAEARKTPQQKLKDAEEAREQRQAGRVVDARNRQRKKDRAANNASDFDAIFNHNGNAPVGPVRVPGSDVPHVLAYPSPEGLTLPPKSPESMAAAALAAASGLASGVGLSAASGMAGQTGAVTGGGSPDVVSAVNAVNSTLQGKSFVLG